jgi:periplasmic protein TonB
MRLLALLLFVTLLLSGCAPLPTTEDVIPLVRVPPWYPKKAAEMKIEGFVRLKFTVTQSGTVKDIVVMDVQPPGYSFEVAARKCVANWEYKPKVVNGDPVERVGVQTIIRFQIED